jgi:hypothetical protein
MTTMATKMNLKEQIYKALEPFFESTERPPFTSEQLIAMALHSTGAIMTGREVIRWVVQRSAHYANQAIDSDRGYFVLDFFRHTLTEYDFPIEVYGREDGLNEAKLSMTTAAAALVLGDVLEQGSPTSDKDAFGRNAVTSTAAAASDTDQASLFWEVRVELRVRIYEYVFWYPPSGLRYDGSRWHAVSRDFAHPINMREWDHPNETGLLEIPGLRYILAPLLASKQFYQEALPIFYNTNTFHFGRDDEGLWRLLKRIPQKHLQHFKNVMVDYAENWREIRAKGVMYLHRLLSMQRTWNLRLKTFTIRLKDRDWAYDRNGNERPRDIPGVELLKEMSGYAHVCVLDGPKIEASQGERSSAKPGTPRRTLRMRTCPRVRMGQAAKNLTTEVTRVFYTGSFSARRKALWWMGGDSRQK